jgi:HNH endonuclease
MGFPQKVKEDALIAAGRHCCLCHKFCGTKIEVHHIRQKAENGEDGFDNAIPVCFDCHADMTSYDHKHPKGTKYTQTELVRHRDNWYSKIEGNIGLANRTEVVETDKSVYRQLLKIMPWDGTITFLRQFDFAGGLFERKSINELSMFSVQCDNPAFEFIDPDLEGLRVQLSEKIAQMRSLVGLKTFPSHMDGYNSVPSEWEEENPKRFHDSVNLLNDAADNVCQAYDALVKTSIRKLGVIDDNLRT